ncbi:MAG: tryptophan synthase subunit alpha [bacterium]|nr:tryptophan synthase subunit alpha [bacterium]
MSANKNVSNCKSIMTHIVVGYPSIKDNRKIIKAMSDAGVKYIELQIPFSDPIADGPTILNANQVSLELGTSVSQCFDFAREMAVEFPDINFLFMTYYNIVFNFGIEKFVKQSKNIGMYGLIVPDIPPEEDNGAFFTACEKNSINPILVISPTTSDRRLANMKKMASGFIYCTSRIGITGAGKGHHNKLKNYITHAKKIIPIPVAVGFGIDSAEKAGAVSKFSDIVVIGSKVIKIVDESPDNYPEEVFSFLSGVAGAL